MKTNIHRENYNGTPNNKGHWWVWKETCDKCGVIIFNESCQHSKAPDGGADFCTECLRHFIDNGITYKEAERIYTR